MSSQEETIEDQTKRELENLKIAYYAKTAPINEETQRALEQAPSKSGGNGKNYTTSLIGVGDIAQMGFNFHREDFIGQTRHADHIALGVFQNIPSLIPPSRTAICHNLTPVIARIALIDHNPL